VYFVTGLNLVLQQPSTATLAKTKADIAKKALIATCIVALFCALFQLAKIFFEFCSLYVFSKKK
jgi:hypothetical protein